MCAKNYIYICIKNVCLCTKSLFWILYVNDSIGKAVMSFCINLNTTCRFMTTPNIHWVILSLQLLGSEGGLATYQVQWPTLILVLFKSSKFAIQNITFVNFFHSSLLGFCLTSDHQEDRVDQVVDVLASTPKSVCLCVWSHFTVSLALNWLG